MMEYINVIVDDIQYEVFSQEEENFFIPNQHVLPNVPNKITIIHPQGHKRIIPLKT